METFIALFRGINVNGKNIIKMDTLKNIFIELGCLNPVTYIQSGNVVFKYPQNKIAKLEPQIKNAIEKKLSLNVHLQIASHAKIKFINDNNPFLAKGYCQDFFHVTLLNMSPDKIEIEKLSPQTFLPDEFIINDNVVFLHCPNGYGKTKLTNNFFETKLKCLATTRNWNTVGKLNELGNKLA